MGILLFGPGERLTDLMRIVSATSPRAAVRQIRDLDELSEGLSGNGTLLVDADLTPAEDVGYLRRFLARHETFAMTLVGEDSSRRVPRILLRRPRARWMHWPPDLDDLRDLASPAAAPEIKTAPVPVAAAAPVRRKPVPSAAVDELDEIESILDMDGDTAEDLGTETEPPSRPSAGPAAPPKYFRDQVADLADIAQKIEGGVATARDEGTLAGAKGEALEGDVARLVQFTRTLSYLSAPPPRGEQVFDLSELLETLVDALPRKGAQAPRWLVRTNGPLNVRSDREVLLQAFDALIFVADQCSARGENVRVQATTLEGPGAPLVRVSIDFPQGKLAGLDPASVVEPYGLRRILPDLGPNALSAAAGILAGQGGRLELRPGRGRMTWLVELPLSS
jgi:hypothetical protein